MNYSRLRFYLSYLYYKLRIPFDGKEERFSLIVAEIIWVVDKIFKIKLNVPESLKKTYFVTKFGKFHVTPDLISMITVSPAFEREDIEFLIRLIEEKKGRKLFIDIGANFGLYTVIFGNRFKRLDIISFEPGTEYISLPAFKILKKNISENNLKNVKPYNLGIGSKNGVNKLKIKTKTLDSVLNSKMYQIYKSVFIKLDIDDFVIDGLEGIEKSVAQFNEVFLLVEDFVLPDQTLSYLNRHNYKFIAKLTPYNSFWKREK